MTLEGKIGQLVMFGVRGTELDNEEIQFIKDYKPGNVILFARNLKSPEQMRDLCKEIHKHIKEATGETPFIAIDQEGGVVSRLPDGATKFPSAMAVSSTNLQNAYDVANLTAKELSALGVNCNFAPVADINTNPQNPVIGVRSYGKTPDDVTPYVMESVKGHIDAGVLPVVKHFPGHGDTVVDSHLGLPCVDKTEEELWACELAPFKEAFAQNAPSVMIAHILYPALGNPDVPASLSKEIIQNILREKMGFKGLVFSDCLQMKAVQDLYGTPESFLRAISSGTDIGCICHDIEFVKTAIALVKDGIENKTFSMEIIDSAVERVLNAKERFSKTSDDFKVVGCEEHMKKASKIMLESITRFDELGELPKIDSNTHFISCPMNRASIVSSVPLENWTFGEVMAKAFDATYTDIPINPDDTDIEKALEKVEKGQTVVTGSYNGHLNTEQLKLINALDDKGCSVISVALRNPYDLFHLNENIYKIAAYEYTSLAMEALEQVLRGVKTTATNSHV